MEHGGRARAQEIPLSPRPPAPPPPPPPTPLPRPGIGQGRVTDNLRPALPFIDSSLRIDDARTIAMVFRLIKDEGIFVGASSALNVVAAGDVARQLGPGHTVVTVVCDGAYRYQTRLFSRKWLEAKGLLAAVPDDCLHFVSLP